jgi:uncharacterized PurR-regulated membrane protein YhhQ (DUF165 family)
MKNGIVLACVAMTLAVVASNFLVELQINQWLTWGAFTYPVTFFITELTNYFYGPKIARRVVYSGFVVAVLLSVWLANPQIAFASGSAFLVGQLLDITIFSRLRRKRWWIAPASASISGSLIDTMIFFTIAFWGQGLLIVTLGLGDFLIKLAMDLVLLLPFRIILWSNYKGRVMMVHSLR